MNYNVEQIQGFNKMHSQNRHRRPSHLFLEAINFELTYQCNMRCSHCLQLGLRRTDRPEWIDTDVAKKAIEDAYTAGLIKTGLNFTGGEIFVPGSNLPDLLEVAKSLNTDVRVNTNGWWGSQDNIRIGDFVFKSPGKIVTWLREMNVAVLALSFDRRYEERDEWWHSTVAVIRECENQGQLYQIILTGVSTEKMMDSWRRLTIEAGIEPYHLLPVEMEMIDIGGAATRTQKSAQFPEFENLLQCLECEGKGFYRPTYLHISPDGGVRSCLYAPGSGWLGNIYNDSLTNIVNKFKKNCVVEAFSIGNLSDMLKTILEPYIGTYKSIKHPCAAAAVSSKVIEKYDQFKKNYQREPTDEELNLINVCISHELNLNRNSADVLV